MKNVYDQIQNYYLRAAVDRGSPGAELYRVLQRFIQTHPALHSIKLADIPEANTILTAPEEIQREALVTMIGHFGTAPGRQMLHSEYWIQRDLVSRLIQRKLPLSAPDLLLLLGWCSIDLIGGALGHVLSAIERYAATQELPDELRTALVRARKEVQSGYRSSQHTNRLVGRINELLGESSQAVLLCDANEVFGQKIILGLRELDEKDAAAMQALLLHASTADGGKPAKVWLKQAELLLQAIDRQRMITAIVAWCEAFDQPRPQEEGRHGERSNWYVADMNSILMKGIIWLSVLVPDDRVIRAISKAGVSGQRKIPMFGPRSSKVTNAAVWALGEIDRPLALGQLAILRSRIKNKATQKQIDKAMSAIARRLGVSPEEVEELAVPTYGLAEVGRRTDNLGGFTAELKVNGTSSPELRWLAPSGIPQKSVPKAVKDNFAEDLKELKAAAKDIEKMLPAQRDRLDLLHLQQKTWAYGIWAERYLNHPLVGTLARRLIWVFDQGESKGKVEAVWLDGRLVDATGKHVEIDSSSAVVSMWHPIGHDEGQIMAWRAFFEERQIKQPFKQAHREVYLLTDAERNTNSYSNRYAAHIIKQHQFNALCAARGWRNKLRLMVDDTYPPASRELPNWGLRAEFWVEGAGEEYGVDTNESGTYLYLTTDQVRFYPLDAAQLSAHASGGGYGWSRYRGEAEPEPIPLDQIPPLVFNEIMRDVDLFVGVASVGNDPNWADGGPEGRYQDYWHSYSFGDLSATANTRKQILGRLVPRLKIADRCSLDDKFLVVRGDIRTYKIHLGSGNILMAPNDQYLCIVPKASSLDAAAGKVFLPFEGDRTLAIILSKAFLLADDRKITDPTILSQLKR